MKTATIQRQYDEVIASHYDGDPQAVIGPSLDRAAEQLCRQQFLDPGAGSLRVLDFGIGIGLFLAKLKALGGEHIQPFGLDLSPRMIDSARRKIPDLVAELDDAANLDAHFPNQSFDLICTHCNTGFVAMHVLALKIWSQLADGGYWSLVGATKAAFPMLQAKANGKLVRWVYGGKNMTEARGLSSSHRLRNSFARFSERRSTKPT
jgi:SAM-dependent methyltransferase